MTYEILNSISTITGIACLVMAALSIGLFFLLKIPEAFLFLSGRTERRGIETIRRTGTTNAGTGSAKSQKLSKTKKKEQKERVKKPANPERRKPVTDVLPGNGSTTDVLSGKSGQTTLLNGAASGSAQVVTQPLHQNLVFTEQPFVVEFDITYVSSPVVIGEEYR